MKEETLFRFYGADDGDGDSVDISDCSVDIVDDFVDLWNQKSALLRSLQRFWDFEVAISPLIQLSSPL